MGELKVIGDKQLGNIPYKPKRAVPPAVEKKVIFVWIIGSGAFPPQVVGETLEHRLSELIRADDADMGYPVADDG